jgi:arylsulfatase A-like enzyme
MIRSMHANTPSHEQSMRLMNCGDERLNRPSMGAWLTYGLGSVNQNLPGFVVLCPGLPVADVSNWRSAFLPGIYQGTHIDTRRKTVPELIENIANNSIGQADQRRQIDLLAEFNKQHQKARDDEPALEARIQSFELAYRMQMEASDAFDVTREPQTVRDEYGDTIHGRQLLIARRLLERGVRIVQCYHGDVQPWDSHEHIDKNHRALATQIDGPLSALLTDLKRRGMLHDTLVICGGEFGRTPAVELTGGKPALGRDHNHYGFTVWLAGGGVKGGTVYGATDDFGYKAVDNPVHVHDLHATILYLMGFDHEKLTYRHSGRDFRLTDVEGEVLKTIVA